MRRLAVHAILMGLVLLVPAVTRAQWEPDVRLTNDTAGSLTESFGGRCVAASGDSIYVVWLDLRGAGSVPRVWMKRSLDGGSTWEADHVVSASTSSTYDPCVAVSGASVYVAWRDIRDGTNAEIYFKGSSDGGVTWGPDTRISNNPAVSTQPAIACSGQTVHIVWIDGRTTPYSQIFYRRSTDGGVTWGPETQITFATRSAWEPSLTAAGSTVVASWQLTGLGNDIYCMASLDGGTTWGGTVQVCTDPAVSYSSTVAVSGAKIHVAWFDQRDGNYEIYYNNSTSGGGSWGPETRLTNATGSSKNPCIDVSGDVVRVAWMDDRDGNWEVYAKESTDGGATWGPDTRLTNATNHSHYPGIVTSGSAVHVVWTDYRDGNSEIYYKRELLVPTGVEIAWPATATGLRLAAPSPNPAQRASSVRIAFELPAASDVSLVLYDVHGREVATLASGRMEAGRHTVDARPGDLPSGIYYYRLRAGQLSGTSTLCVID